MTLPTQSGPDDNLLDGLRIAMLLDHPGHYDSRIAREAVALGEAGHEVRVFALQRSTDPVTNEGMPEDVAFTPCPLDETGTIPVLSAFSRSLTRKRVLKARRTDAAARDHFGARGTPSSKPSPTSPQAGLRGRIKRLLGELVSPRAYRRAVEPAVRAFAPDIVHAHDLSMLGAGVALARTLGARLIYDAHEYERGRNAANRPLLPALAARRERRGARSADAVITVGDRIADALEHELGIARPHVILNSESGLASPPPAPARELKADLGLPEDARLALYTGRVGPGRGLERLLAAVSRIDGLHLALLAPNLSPDATAPSGGHAYLRSCLRACAADVGAGDLEGRVHVLRPRPPGAVVEVIARADISVLPLDDAGQSYAWSLPNKLFQSVAAGVPAVATPLPEIAAFLATTCTGTIASDFTADAFAHAMRQALSEPYTPRRDLLSAYDWTTHAERLRDVVRAVGAEHPQVSASPLPHSRPHSDNVGVHPSR